MRKRSCDKDSEREIEPVRDIKKEKKDYVCVRKRERKKNCEKECESERERERDREKAHVIA